eukprot:m.357356 g.357356  ORF g.357356 m.357356 type:complete len:78 (+) comp55969_c0_seq19:66-299(+)
MSCTASSPRNPRAARSFALEFFVPKTLKANSLSASATPLKNQNWRTAHDRDATYCSQEKVPLAPLIVDIDSGALSEY